MEIKEELDIYLKKSELHSIKENWVMKNLPNLWKYINTNFNEYSISEGVFIHLNGINYGCKVCKNKTKFLSIKRGYREYCSNKCSNSDTDLISSKLIKYKSTNMEKYGVDNPSKLKEVKEKISKTKIDNYDEVTINKFKNSFMEKYGVDNPSKLESVKLKKIETCRKNWGVDNPFQNIDIKEKIRNIINDRIGFDHPMKSDSINKKRKKTLSSKYGVDNPMKSDYIKNNFKKTCQQNWGHDHFRSSDEFKSICLNTHLDKLNLDIPNINIINLDNKKYKILCLKCNELSEISINLFNIRKNINMEICVICNPILKNVSISETEIYNYISSVYNGRILRNFRNGKEIDIYLPDLEIGIEFNGTYWHSDIFKSDTYHFDKFKYFEDKNIDIIQIWEDDWTNKKDILKSMILNKVGLSEIVYLDEYTIRCISDPESIDFLNNNHIDGYIPSDFKYGIFKDGSLISSMSVVRMTILIKVLRTLDFCVNWK